MTLENCLKKLEEIGIASAIQGNVARLEKSNEQGPPVPFWGILDTKYVKRAYLPSKEHLEKSIGNNPQLPSYMETYNSMMKILKKEGFKLLFYTEVNEGSF